MHTLRRASHIPLYYGFVPVSLSITRTDRDRARAITPEGERAVEERAALLRLYEEEKMERLLRPAMFYRERRSTRGATIHLDILGNGKGVLEALLLTITLAILREGDTRTFTLHLNSIGDRDSFSRFTRELSLFYRKRAGDLHHMCKNACRENPLRLLSCTHEACQAVLRDAPNTLSFLSEGARTHFKEVLEHLETLDIPYTLREHLIGPSNACSHTVFTVENEAGERIASGSRYNTLARRLGFRREISALGVSISVSESAALPLTGFPQPKMPAVYFVQLGERARRASIRIIESLRQARIPLAHSIAHDQLALQLSHAEELNTPYLIIVGHKEAMEGTALVRDRGRSFQETVSEPELPVYLNRLLARAKVC